MKHIISNVKFKILQDEVSAYLDKALMQKSRSSLVATNVMLSNIRSNCCHNPAAIHLNPTYLYVIRSTESMEKIVGFHEPIAAKNLLKTAELMNKLENMTSGRVGNDLTVENFAMELLQVSK